MKKVSNILGFIIIALFLSACQRDNENFDGPSLVDRYGEFNVVSDLGVSSATADFAAGQNVFFTAEFNKSVDWVVTVTGNSSGAVRRITGFSRVLNAETATWNGNTTTLPFFKEETCTAVLTVAESPEYSSTTSVTVVSPRVYPGSLFTDFETNPGNNIFFGNFEFELVAATSGRRNGPLQPAQGDFYYFLEGTDNVVPNFFVGLANISAGIAGSTYAQLPTTVPEQLYFNCFIWHDGSPNGIAVIQFVFDSNNSGAFEDGQDQTFQLSGDIPLNWTGWRQHSVKMSDVGMTQAQLEKLVTIRILLISNLNNQSNPPTQVRYGIDYLTFTQNAPLQL